MRTLQSSSRLVSPHILEFAKSGWTLQSEPPRSPSAAVFGNLTNMGARVARMFRNFNLENRAFREISKEKPQAAPRHAVSAPAAAGSSGGECPLIRALVTGNRPPAVGHTGFITESQSWELICVENNLEASTAHESGVVCFSAVGAEDPVNKKNDPLLNLLKSVYVESTDPAAAEVRPGHSLRTCAHIHLRTHGSLCHFKVNVLL